MLTDSAKQVLEANWQGAYSIPRHKLYPFQWNWDAGFAALGWAHFHPERAIAELKSLFTGQWKNGMIPHIIFHREDQTSYFPNHDFWRVTEVNAGAPKQPLTSGISQPPVHGFIAELLLEICPEHPGMVDFIRWLYPKILASHRFFYHYRDPNKEGLLVSYHPWETGRDNSPLWDGALQEIHIPAGSLPAYQRKDTQHADSSERPRDHDYDRYVYLLLLAQQYGYDGAEIMSESPFLLQDTGMNAILVRSNEAMIRLGKRFQLDTAEVEEWQQQSIRSFNTKLWNAALGCYSPYDIAQQAMVNHHEIGGLMSLFAGLSTTARTQTQVDYLNKLIAEGYYLCPSFNPADALFDSKRYWRGPIWPQMNWMLARGLQANGQAALAQQVRDDLLSLVGQLGFHEYFEANKSAAQQLTRGYGGDKFSWTAATVIDLEMRT